MTAAAILFAAAIIGVNIRAAGGDIAKAIEKNKPEPRHDRIPRQ